MALKSVSAKSVKPEASPVKFTEVIPPVQVTVQPDHTFTLGGRLSPLRTNGTQDSVILASRSGMFKNPEDRVPCALPADITLDGKVVPKGTKGMLIANVTISWRPL